MNREEIMQADAERDKVSAFRSHLRLSKKPNMRNHTGISLLTLLICWPCSELLRGAEDEEPRLAQTFHDPRAIVQFAPRIQDGKELDRNKSIGQALLIICWVPAPDGSVGKYQISGIDGYHSREQVERFLTAFYSLDQWNEKGALPPDLIVAGNNWAVGLELGAVLKELTKAKPFTVYYAGGWGFTRASLVREPEDRMKLIQKAFGEANP